ncbi:MAG: phosphatase PAP2 family protein [Gammaproteobacteria bacterium]|nr:phosphatase PAP2 family protein [Gammaproteobacteria bacterium]
MPSSTLFIDALKLSLADARERLRTMPRMNRWCVWTAIPALFIGVLLFAIGGYHGGFWQVHAVRGVLPAPIWELITFLGDASVAAGVLLLLARRRPDVLLAGSWAVLLAALSSRILKSIAGTARPPAVFDNSLLDVLGPVLRFNAFPSGHTITAFTLAFVLLPAARTTVLRTALIAGACAVAVSRVAIGVHWPVDVSVGAAIGVADAYAAWTLARHWPGGATIGVHVTTVFVLTGLNLWVVTAFEPDFATAFWLVKPLAGIALLVVAVDYLLPLCKRLRS